MERSNAGGKRAGRDRVGMRGRQTAYAGAPPMRETGREMIPRSVFRGTVISISLGHSRREDRRYEIP